MRKKIIEAPAMCQIGGTWFRCKKQSTVCWNCFKVNFENLQDISTFTGNICHLGKDGALDDSGRSFT